METGRGGGETLAFSTVNPTSFPYGALYLAGGSLPARRFATYTDLIGFSWAPSGDGLAVSYRKGP